LRIYINSALPAYIARTAYFIYKTRTHTYKMTTNAKNTPKVCLHCPNCAYTTDYVARMTRHLDRKLTCYKVSSGKEYVNITEDVKNQVLAGKLVQGGPLVKKSTVASSATKKLVMKKNGEVDVKKVAPNARKSMSTSTSSASIRSLVSAYNTNNISNGELVEKKKKKTVSITKKKTPVTIAEEAIAAISNAPLEKKTTKTLPQEKIKDENNIDIKQCVAAPARLSLEGFVDYDSDDGRKKRKVRPNMDIIKEKSSPRVKECGVGCDDNHSDNEYEDVIEERSDFDFMEDEFGDEQKQHKRGKSASKKPKMAEASTQTPGSADDDRLPQKELSAKEVPTLHDIIRYFKVDAFIQRLDPETKMSILNVGHTVDFEDVIEKKYDTIHTRLEQLKYKQYTINMDDFKEIVRDSIIFTTDNINMTNLPSIPPMNKNSVNDSTPFAETDDDDEEDDNVVPTDPLQMMCMYYDKRTNRVYFYNNEDWISMNVKTATKTILENLQSSYFNVYEEYLNTKTDKYFDSPPTVKYALKNALANYYQFVEFFNLTPMNEQRYAYYMDMVKTNKKKQKEEYHAMIHNIITTTGAKNMELFNREYLKRLQKDHTLRNRFWQHFSLEP